MPKGFWGLWFLLFFLWLAINSSLAIETIAVGAFISLALSIFFVRSTSVWRGFNFNFAQVLHFIRYTGVFIVELVRANIDLMRHIYSPALNIRPGTVKLKTNLKSPIGRLAIANSIALTPGSLVLGMDDDCLLVHCLNADAETASQTILEPFEKHLEQVFG